MWLIALLACGHKEPAPDLDAPVIEAMGDHYERAAAARAALVRGDVAAAKAAAADVAAWFKTAKFPSEEAGFDTALVAAAERAAAAPDLESLAEAVGDMGLACGRCHAAAHLDLPETGLTPPPMGSPINQEMARHRAATERMWMGLVLPDELAWREAASALAGASLAPTGLSTDAGLPPLATELEVRVHDLAAAAAAHDADPNQRGRQMGQILATCASCHGLYRK